MGIFSPHLTKTVEKVDPIAGVLARNDPLIKGATGYLTKKVPTAPIAAPTQDTAANADIQQQQALLRRRGILGNVYAGSSSQAPQTAAKTALGN